MSSLRRRSLCLGSVSSLSFEEEDRIKNRFGVISYAASNDDKLNRSKNGSATSLECRDQGQDMESRQLQELLANRLEEQIIGLMRSHSTSPNLAVIGLSSTLSDVVQDILRLSEDEPYGVRGATIMVKFRNFKGENERKLGAISVDVDTVSTFNLILVLQEERRLSVAIRNWFGQLTGRSQALMIGPTYVMHKEKLYRSYSGTTISKFHL